MLFAGKNKQSNNSAAEQTDLLAHIPHLSLVGISGNLDAAYKRKLSLVPQVRAPERTVDPTTPSSWGANLGSGRVDRGHRQPSSRDRPLSTLTQSPPRLFPARRSADNCLVPQVRAPERTVDPTTPSS